MDDAENLDELIDLPDVTDPTIRRMLGLFDLPAYARRGQELNDARHALRNRCTRERSDLLGMVRLRLRQWTAAATGPDDWQDVWAAPIAHLWPAAAADPPLWSVAPAPRKRRESIARDLVTSVQRFNRRWRAFVHTVDLENINRMIHGYNRYYLLEKECSLGSPRLAARAFQTEAPVTPEQLLDDHPILAIPLTRAARP